MRQNVRNAEDVGATPTGVAACFDLDGRRRWITRIPGELSYASSPALVDGKLIVFMNRLYGIDEKTGQIVWQQKKISRIVAGFSPARARRLRAELGNIIYASKDGITGTLHEKKKAPG